MIPIYIITAALILYMVTVLIHGFNGESPWSSTLSWVEGLFIGIIAGIVTSYFIGL